MNLSAKLAMFFRFIRFSSQLLCNLCLFSNAPFWVDQFFSFHYRKSRIGSALVFCHSRSFGWLWDIIFVLPLWLEIDGRTLSGDLKTLLTYYFILSISWSKNFRKCKFSVWQRYLKTFIHFNMSHCWSIGNSSIVLSSNKL